MFQPASARGLGIKVINKWSQIPKKKAVVVQTYVVMRLPLTKITKASLA